MSHAYDDGGCDDDDDDNDVVVGLQMHILSYGVRMCAVLPTLME